MSLKIHAIAGISLAVALTGALPGEANAEGEQFIPLLVYRTGPYAPNGIPLANGRVDYLEMVNARDGGVGGVTLTYEECDTGYNNDRGVECYERLKGKGETGATAFGPFSTGITYALIERATADKIPLFTMGYGRTDASDGRVFPYVFTAPSTYWSQASVLIKYISEQEGGMDNLAGKKIALVYHDSAYGKEPIKTLEVLAEQYGYELHLFPVAHPGLEQKSTWLKLGRQLRPDWTLMWGWGVMNSTAIKEAAAVGYPMEKFIGNWWAGAEPDVTPGGDASKGYLSANFHAPGTDSQVMQDILEHVYGGDEAAAREAGWGEVLYNRGVINSAITVEAVRAAQAIHGDQPLTGEQVRDGFEALNLDEAALEERALAGFMPPISITCADHEGSHPIRVQQWDGEQFTFVSDWIEPMQDVVRPLIEESAMAYAEEKGIEPRSCE
ncbi:MAG: ABC transporter substrate-binding protein [Geminicoccaceae bacterium]